MERSRGGARDVRVPAIACGGAHGGGFEPTGDAGSCSGAISSGAGGSDRGDDATTGSPVSDDTDSPTTGSTCSAQSCASGCFDSTNTGPSASLATGTGGVPCTEGTLAGEVCQATRLRSRHVLVVLRQRLRF